MYKLHIGVLEFEWDEGKNAANIRKHGVSFHEAADAFRDGRSSLYYDEPHSEYEDRFYLIGMSSKPNLLVVCHCYRSEESTIRIISARRATTHEESEYQRHPAG